MIAGYLQIAPHFGLKEHNFDVIRSLAHDVRADLLVLPELFATGYTFTSPDEVKTLSEPVNGPTARFLMELSALTGAVMVGGLVETENGKYYNSCLVTDHENIGRSTFSIRKNSGSRRETGFQRLSTSEKPKSAR